MIVLKADADKGTIAHQGAIEDPLVKDAIVRVLDGGPEAFNANCPPADEADPFDLVPEFGQGLLRPAGPR